MVQWLGLVLSLQRAQVQSQVTQATPCGMGPKKKAQKWERACCKWRTTGVFLLQLHLLSSLCYGKCEVGSGAVRGRLGSNGKEPCLSL